MIPDRRGGGPAAGPGRLARRVPVQSGQRRSDHVLAAPPPGAPTPIWISHRQRTLLALAGLVLLVLLLWRASSVLTFALGGAALALVLSFPVRLLGRVMGRRLAILASFLLVVGLVVLAVVVVVPIVVAQLGALVSTIPDIAQRIDARLPRLVEGLSERGLLPATPERFLTNLRQEAIGAVEAVARWLLGSFGRIVGRTVTLAITLFGIVFVAVYLLADSRRIHAAVLRAAPHRYRHDARDLWNAFEFTLARYLGGLGLSLAIQGGLSAIALYGLGVPYALLLGTWVSVTAVVPFLGAWIGAIPAVLLAFSVSPTTALLTALLFLAIQQLEGNVLTPRIQGQAVRVHPILVFLTVIAGGELFGVAGVIFAVPVLAVLRVLYDFLRVRLRTVERRADADGVRDARP